MSCRGSILSWQLKLQSQHLTLILSPIVRTSEQQSVIPAAVICQTLWQPGRVRKKEFSILINEKKAEVSGAQRDLDSQPLVHLASLRSSLPKLPALLTVLPGACVTVLSNPQPFGSPPQHPLDWTLIKHTTLLASHPCWPCILSSWERRRRWSVEKGGVLI